MPLPSFASGIRLLLATASVLVALDANAQTASPVQSFAELKNILKSRQQIIVLDESGHTRRGRFVSINDDRLEMETPRLFRFNKWSRHVLSEATVQRVVIRDSTWNGWLIGAAAGAGLGTYAIANCQEVCDAGGLSYFLVSTILFGGEVGGLIDFFKNRRVFESPGKPPIVVEPLVGPTQIGVVARIRF